jgi:Spy/CpxP family protein refolding chaperone
MAWFLVALLVMTVAAVPWTVYAGSKMKHRSTDSPLCNLVMGSIGRLMVLRSELNVTGEQNAKIHEVLADREKEIAGQMKEVWQKRNALRDLVLSGKGDEAAIRKAADDLGKEIGNAAVLGTKLRNQIAPVLTAEQRELLKKFRDDNDAAAERFFDKMIKGE